MADEELVVVRTYQNSLDAELALSALEAAGIEAIIRRDDGAGVQPALWLRGIDVLVRFEDAPAATELLDSDSPDASVES